VKLFFFSAMLHATLLSVLATMATAAPLEGADVVHLPLARSLVPKSSGLAARDVWAHENET
jgi:hypothetical protein